MISGLSATSHNRSQMSHLKGVTCLISQSKVKVMENNSLYLRQLRKVWLNDHIECPYCQSERFTPVPSEGRYRCNACSTSFSLTTGTMFHRTRVPLEEWFRAIALILDDGTISVRSLATSLGVTNNTAARIKSRTIRAAVVDREKLEELVR
jgi:transposase-like protein